MPIPLHRLFPRTIFWRLAALTALALLLSLAFVVGLFGYARQQLVANQVAEQAAEQLAAIEDALDGLTPAEQLDWLQRSQRGYAPHLRSRGAPPPAPYAPPLGPLERAIAAALHDKIPGSGEVREAPPPRRQLWVRVSMLGKPYWLVIPLGRYRADPTWTLAATATIFALAALAVAALFAWRINRPLRELRLAAGRLGRGERPEPLPETGPLEVKELSASFNRMLADLDATERERGVMLAGISHDLRTPLARLKLGVEMMADDSLRDGMREDVEDIERILGQFIDFARGLGNEQAREGDPAELARGVVARYARGGCAVELLLDDELPLVPLRPLALSRALANLIDNARRYGAAPYSLGVHADAGSLRFVVGDRGPGIPADQIATALQPFQRLDSARRADGGSGLGLAIVERIARQHGGTLALDPRDGGGLLATIRLPLALG
ncbi:ATP-binding protein [Chitinimonas koreensis]|uniref:ATP-binding protein n=1 Tax=Chitinimonas koreensis TaxID=356302 RepID=UPI0005534FC6|nr:ATP-binding protein [Chitinimonas koreensis]QNM96005.1 HAMP domain-containing protein [Chitinimonas koreensis]